jgi:CPA1 family monovalent cation:H+ antiporter
MEFFHVFSAILAISAVFSFLNNKFIKLPATIGLMLAGLLLSLATLALDNFFPELFSNIKQSIHDLDFSEFLLDFMLGFLLFAGALHTDYNKLANSKWPILTFATVGVLISAFLVAGTIFLLFQWFYQPVDFLHCLLFGALIAPTDPIAVLGILRQEKVPESLETKITGESLFNDGVGVVLFVTLFRIAESNSGEIDFGMISEIVLLEIGGGLGLGLVVGFLGLYLMKQIDHYQTEVLITLGMVAGGYSLATIWHLSGPLAMVVAGLMVGNRGKSVAMSEETLEYVDRFWEIIDEILNATLFLLIGLELLVITFKINYIWFGLVMAVLVVLIRFFALWLPSVTLGFHKTFSKNALKIMTWGGLKGGISIALALSLQESMSREVLVSITYVVVIFSLAIQGTTIGKLIRKLQ